MSWKAVFENPVNRNKIQEALSYVHYWEKNGETRAQAARDAVRLGRLNNDETDILLNALHVKRSEIRENPGGRSTYAAAKAAFHRAAKRVDAADASYASRPTPARLRAARAARDAYIAASHDLDDANAGPVTGGRFGAFKPRQS